MKRTTWATALLLAILMIVGFGCSTDKSSDSPGGVGAVQVVMDTDTLKFVPGDSAVSNGFAVVTDRDGVVMKGIPVSITITPVIGLIEWENIALKDTTDDYGRVRFFFRSFSQPGSTIIKASIGNVSGTWELWVRQANEIIESLTVQVVPRDLRVSSSSEDSAKVVVTVKDSNSVGIGGVSVILSATGGRLRQLGATDSTGRAETWWFNNREFGLFFVTGRVADFTAFDTVEVWELAGEIGTLEVQATPRKVQADGCISRAQIIATLKDQYSTPVIGDTIRFSSPPPLGTVLNGIAITDSSGIAHTAMCEYTTPSSTPIDSAMIIARYVKWGLIDTVRIFIDPASRVTRVDLSATPSQGIAGVDSASILIHAFDENNNGINGLIAYLGATCGRFSVDTVVLVNGTHNQTPISWKFCNETTTSLAPAKIAVTVGGMTSDSFSIDVNPGPARKITVVPGSLVIPPLMSTDIVAFVQDSLNNMVNGGVPVIFESTLGSLSPESPLSTNDDGTARVTLTPGTQAGQTVVKATVGTVYTDSTVIRILSSSAASIGLDVPNPSPQVAGTGGVDFTVIIANVRDQNGNPVQDGQWVYFTIIGSPGGGCSLSRDSVQTSAGAAQVTFNSGTIPGPVTIQACTYLPDTTLYCVNATNISIVAGPPRSIYLQPTDVGVSVASVAWDVAIGALVGDQYNNPVRDGIAVYFELDPAIALVVSDTVVTGNGPHRPGVAVTVIRYPSDQTFQHVNITARTADPNMVTTTIDYILPLQTPSINLQLSHSTWHFTADGGPWCMITCGAWVKDANNRNINGATVIYSVTRGRFWTTATRTLQRNWNKTGPDFGYDNGYTQLFLSEQEQFIFPPNSNEITADVQAEIQGTGIIDGQPINFRRGVGR